MLSGIFYLNIFCIFLQMVKSDLNSFGLPSCCYPPSHLSDSLEGAPSSDIVYTNSNRNSEFAKLRKFMFEIPQEQQTKVKKKRATLLSKEPLTNSSFDLLHLDELPMTKSNENASASQVSSFLPNLPSDWSSNLRKALFRSIKTINKNLSKNGSVQKLREEIYEAPLQVIDFSTKNEIRTSRENPLNNSGRISGVMVNTQDGIELRSTMKTIPKVSEAVLVGDPAAAASEPVTCDCRLIKSGDTLLAYWTVAPQGNNQLEALIYPVESNVPTPPIFDSFHTDLNFRPSPIDLNPGISSRIGHLPKKPFQASLEYGVDTKKAFQIQPVTGVIQFHQGSPHFGVGIPSPLGISQFPPPIAIQPPSSLRNPPLLQMRSDVPFQLPIPPFPPIQPVPFDRIDGVIDQIPRIGHQFPNAFMQENLEQEFPPNFPPVRKNSGPGSVTNSFVIGPLNTNHPNSIQEILGVNRLPPIVPNALEEYGPIPPGPNSGIDVGNFGYPGQIQDPNRYHLHQGKEFGKPKEQKVKSYPFKVVGQKKFEEEHLTDYPTSFPKASKTGRREDIDYDNCGSVYTCTYNRKSEDRRFHNRRNVRKPNNVTFSTASSKASKKIKDQHNSSRWSKNPSSGTTESSYILDF